MWRIVKGIPPQKGAPHLLTEGVQRRRVPESRGKKKQLLIRKAVVNSILDSRQEFTSKTSKTTFAPRYLQIQPTVRRGGRGQRKDEGTPGDRFLWCCSLPSSLKVVLFLPSAFWMVLSSSLFWRCSFLSTFVELCCFPPPSLPLLGGCYFPPWVVLPVLVALLSLLLLFIHLSNMIWYSS